MRKFIGKLIKEGRKRLVYNTNEKMIEYSFIRG